MQIRSAGRCRSAFRLLRLRPSSQSCVRWRSVVSARVTSPGVPPHTGELLNSTVAQTMKDFRLGSFELIERCGGNFLSRSFFVRLRTFEYAFFRAQVSSRAPRSECIFIAFWHVRSHAPGRESHWPTCEWLVGECARTFGCDGGTVGSS